MIESGVIRYGEAVSYTHLGCKAYASTAGFESVCEAMYLGKPILMVPAHIEQDCNASVSYTHLDVYKRQESVG